MIAFARASTVSEGRETESLLLLFGLLELLDVDGLLHLLASSYRGLDEGLTGHEVRAQHRSSQTFS